jgi:hypothetical protein
MQTLLLPVVVVHMQVVPYCSSCSFPPVPAEGERGMPVVKREVVQDCFTDCGVPLYSPNNAPRKLLRSCTLMDAFEYVVAHHGVKCDFGCNAIDAGCDAMR